MTPVEEAIAALEPMVAVRDYLAQFNLKDDWPFAGTLLVWADFRRAAQALSRLRADGEGWRAIEEAPRDGTHILLAAGQDHVGEGWWEDNDRDPYPWKFIDTGMMGSRYRNGEDINGAHEGNPHAFMFTHFRPLPDPPRS